MDWTNTQWSVRDENLLPTQCPAILMALQIFIADVFCAEIQLKKDECCGIMLQVTLATNLTRGLQNKEVYITHAISRLTPADVGGWQQHVRCSRRRYHR